MFNKERGHSLIGFIALCQSRSPSVAQTYGASHRRPASVLASGSALGSVPTGALSSAQRDRILPERKTTSARKISRVIVGRMLDDPDANSFVTQGLRQGVYQRKRLACPPGKGVKTCVLRAISVGRF